MKPWSNPWFVGIYRGGIIRNQGFLGALGGFWSIHRFPGVQAGQGIARLSLGASAPRLASGAASRCLRPAGPATWRGAILLLPFGFGSKPMVIPFWDRRTTHFRTYFSGCSLGVRFGFFAHGHLGVLFDVVPCVGYREGQRKAEIYVRSKSLPYPFCTQSSGRRGTKLHLSTPISAIY